MLPASGPTARWCTFNRKVAGDIRAVTAEYHERAYNLDDFEDLLAGIDDPGEQPAGAPPPIDLAPAKLPPILDGCAWMRHWRDDAASLAEPEWYRMLTVVARCEGVERWAYELSQGYPKVTVDAKGHVTSGASLGPADLPEHTHTASHIVSGELPHKVQHNGADVGTRRAINRVEGARVTLDAANDPTNDRVSVVVNAAPPVAGEITNALGYVPANHAGDHFTGPVDCGPQLTIGGPLENMAKHSENFAAATWDKKRCSCSVTSNAVIAPDRNQSADVITAATTTSVIQQRIAGLADGGTYTFYAWARVPSGTRKISLAIVNNAYAAYLAGPTQVR
jgi:hypothetical protein